MSKPSVKKGDKVMILSGKDKGKSGKVLQVVPADNKVLVEGVNMAVKHKKPRNQKQQGGIIHQEAPLNVSKVMVVCKNCGEPTRVGRKILEDGTHVRVCKNEKCGEQLD